MSVALAFQVDKQARVAPAPTTAASPLQEAALAYAARGWAVIPLHSPTPGGGCTCREGGRCKNPGKHPRSRSGLTSATTDPARIRGWWGRWPEANIGLATEGLLVIDVDGPAGEAALAGGELPPCPTATTGRGRHLFFADVRDTARNRAKLLPGVDVRAAGGYVVAVPSVHASGAVYTWAPGLSPDDLPPPPAPDWLYEALAKTGDPPPGEPARIPQGERSDTLTRLAGARRADGADLPALSTYLHEVNAAQCAPPLPEKEVAAIAASISHYPATPTGDTVRAPRSLLTSELTDGAAVLYLVRQALLQVTGHCPRHAETAAALGVSLATAKRWAAELRSAGLDRYRRPQRRYLRVPVALLTDPTVRAATKYTALCLLSCADADKGFATVGQKALARLTGRSEATVKRDLRTLRDRGHVAAQVAAYDPERGRRVRCSRYTLATAVPGVIGLPPETVSLATRRKPRAPARVSPATPESRPSRARAGVLPLPQTLARPETTAAAPLPAADQQAAEALAAALDLSVGYVTMMVQRHGLAGVAWLADRPA